MPLPENKTCTKCGENKTKEQFRVRTEKRSPKNTKYLNNQCRECDRIDARKRYSVVKNDPEFKKKNAGRVRSHDKKTGYSKKRWQKNKNDPEWNRRLKKWRKENRNRVKQLQKSRSRRHHEKLRDGLTDSYVVTKLKQQFPEVATDQIRQDQELIQIKRAEILIHRLKKSMNNGKK